ncbi:hypothetical protein [Pseudoalteromonas sp. GB56]
MLTVIFISLAITGALSTFFLAKLREFDAIRASSLLAIIAYVGLYFCTEEPNLYAAVFFGGTFVGMSAPHRFGWYTQVSAAVMFALLFQYLVPRLQGYGGAIGVSAFLSVCVCHLAILLGAPRSKNSARKHSEP